MCLTERDRERIFVGIESKSICGFGWDSRATNPKLTKSLAFRAGYKLRVDSPNQISSEVFIISQPEINLPTKNLPKTHQSKLTNLTRNQPINSKLACLTQNQPHNPFSLGNQTCQPTRPDLPPVYVSYTSKVGQYAWL